MRALHAASGRFIGLVESLDLADASRPVPGLDWNVGETVAHVLTVVRRGFADRRRSATAAETAECAMAHLAAGEIDTAARLLRWAEHLRHDDGSYFTGMVHPQRHLFPAGERSTYSAAAVILATAALAGAGPLVPLLTAPTHAYVAANARRSRTVG